LLDGKEGVSGSRPEEGFRSARPLVEPGQSVVRDRLPGRRIGDELTELRTDSGIAVEGAEADAHDLGVVRVAAPELRTALRAELLREPGLRLLRADEVFA
jgi:hypothetical protein